jgi:Tol biopolymer transport system component
MQKFVTILAAGTILTVIFLAFSLFENKSKDTANWEWGAAKNLGPHINSGSKDEHATFTPDGQTMVIASTREGGFGAYDLYFSRFEKGEWTKAELLPLPINTQKDDFDPFITPDGKKLFFASNRDNSDKYWDCDIYVSSWSGEGWTAPELYDPVFITPDKPDWGATVTRDFKTFIFSSGRDLDKPHSVQIFQSKRQEKEWLPPCLLPFPVNAGEWEATPYITPDGKSLYLNSIRGGSDKEDVDIWRFELKGGKWTNPRLMDGPFLSDNHDYDPCLSPDGKKFYFTSDRDGGLGDSDIYVVEKIKR